VPLPDLLNLNKISGKIFSIFDMSCAYHQVPLEETQKLVSFVIDGVQYKFLRGFYGLSGLPSFFSRIMLLTFRPLIEKKEALTYIDDVLLMSDCTKNMFKTIKEFHQLL